MSFRDYLKLGFYCLAMFAFTVACLGGLFYASVGLVRKIIG